MLSTSALDIITTMEKSYGMFVLADGPQSLAETFSKSVKFYVEDDRFPEEVVFASLSHKWINDMSDLSTYGIRKNSDRAAWEVFDSLVEDFYLADDFTPQIHEAATALSAKL